MQRQKHKSRFARKLNRVMAYIYVPLLFSFLAYGVAYLMASDLIRMAVNTVSLIMSDEAPEFETEYNSVFVKNAVEVQEDDGVEKVKRSDVGIADYGEMYAYVRCTRIALDAPVYKVMMTQFSKNWSELCILTAWIWKARIIMRT